MKAKLNRTPTEAGPPPAAMVRASSRTPSARKTSESARVEPWYIGRF
jgi:hypothetical protein